MNTQTFSNHRNFSIKEFHLMSLLQRFKLAKTNKCFHPRNISMATRHPSFTAYAGPLVLTKKHLPQHQYKHERTYRFQRETHEVVTVKFHKNPEVVKNVNTIHNMKIPKKTKHLLHVHNTAKFMVYSRPCYGTISEPYLELDTATRKYDLTPDYIAKSVLHGIDDLHKAGYVHMNIRPCSVLTRLNGHVILGAFENLTAIGSPIKRFGSLDYKAPEIKQGVLANPLMDMFAYGKFLEDLCKKHIINVNTQHLQMKMLIACCTDPNPCRRLTAMEALQHLGDHPQLY